MAPKGAKRAAAPSKEEPEAKRVAAFLKSQGVTKSSHEAIREIVQHPLAGLPAECCEMLLAMLPWSLCVPSDERGEAHIEAVKMVEEVVASIQAKMQEAIQSESARVGDLDEKKTSLQADISSAQAALAEAVAAVDGQKAQLAETSAALLQQRRAFGQAEAKKAKDAAELEQIEAQKLEVEKVISDNFRKLKSGEWQVGEEDGLFQPVQALIAKLDLDESLMTSLPVSLKKKERGAFDQVVVDQCEEKLNAKVDELVATISTMRSTATGNAATVEELKAALEEAQGKQQAVATQFGDAQEISTKAAAKVKEAEGVLAAFEPEYARATAVREEKVAELQGFEDYHMCILKTMVEQISKKKKAELAAAAAAAAAAEAAAAAAEVAAAAAVEQAKAEQERAEQEKAEQENAAQEDSIAQPMVGVVETKLDMAAAQVSAEANQVSAAEAGA